MTLQRYGLARWGGCAACNPQDVAAEDGCEHEAAIEEDSAEGQFYKAADVDAALAAKDAEIARLREALRFYSDGTNYEQVDILGWCGLSDDRDEYGNYGHKARAALEAAP